VGNVLLGMVSEVTHCVNHVVETEKVTFCIQFAMSGAPNECLHAANREQF
jgi:hypothetical protein